MSRKPPISARASFDYAEENMGHNFLVRCFGFCGGIEPAAEKRLPLA
jgi:hypothetical protein